MSLTTVTNKITTAMADNHLTVAEAKDIRAEAAADFTHEVATVVRDLFDRTNAGSFTARNPDAPPPTATEESNASTVLYGLLIGSSVPAGNNRYIKQQIILDHDFRPRRPLAEAPDISRTFPVKMGDARRRDERLVDTAYLDVEKQRYFYKREVISPNGQTDTQWEGPYDLPGLGGTGEPPPNIAAARRANQSGDIPVNAALRDGVARWWLEGSRFQAESFAASAPSGLLAESFLLGHSQGETDTVVTADGDNSKFWIHRVGHAGDSRWAGPFARDDIG